MDTRLFRCLTAAAGLLAWGMPGLASAQVQLFDPHHTHELYATIPDDLVGGTSGIRVTDMAFAGNGDLYVTRVAGSLNDYASPREETLTPLTLLKVAAGQSSVSEYGPAFAWPTSVTVDDSGLITGVPGAVIVGHHSPVEGEHNPVVSAIKGDQADELLRFDGDDPATFYFHPLVSDLATTTEGQLLVLTSQRQGYRGTAALVKGTVAGGFWGVPILGGSYREIQVDPGNGDVLIGMPYTVVLLEGLTVSQVVLRRDLSQPPLLTLFAIAPDFGPFAGQFIGYDGTTGDGLRVDWNGGYLSPDQFETFATGLPFLPRYASGQTVADLEFGPDGYLYYLTNDGEIYRIIPEPGMLAIVLVCVSAVRQRR